MPKEMSGSDAMRAAALMVIQIMGLSFLPFSACLAAAFVVE
jgi:hypothetical protein